MGCRRWAEECHRWACHLWEARSPKQRSPREVLEPISRQQVWVEWVVECLQWAVGCLRWMAACLQWEVVVLVVLAVETHSLIFRLV